MKSSIALRDPLVCTKDPIPSLLGFLLLSFPLFQLAALTWLDPKHLGFYCISCMKKWAFFFCESYTAEHLKGTKGIKGRLLWPLLHCGNWDIVNREGQEVQIIAHLPGIVASVVMTWRNIGYQVINFCLLFQAPDLMTNHRAYMSQTVFGESKSGKKRKLALTHSMTSTLAVSWGCRGLLKCSPVPRDRQLFSPILGFSGSPSSLCLNDVVLNRKQPYWLVFWLHFKVSHWFQFENIIVYLFKNPLLLWSPLRIVLTSFSFSRE